MAFHNPEIPGSSYETMEELEAAKQNNKTKQTKTASTTDKGK